VRAERLPAKAEPSNVIIANAVAMSTLVCHSPEGSKCELEGQPQSELTDARSRPTKAAGCGDLTEGWTVNVCGAVPEGRLCELGMIQRVKELGSKFQLDLLGYQGRLGQSNIEIGQSWTAQHIPGEPVGSVSRVMHGIELPEARIGKASVEVRIVLEWHAGKAVGVKDEVAGDWGRGDLTNRTRGVGAVGDLINCPHFPGIECAYGRNHGGARK